MAVRQDQVQLRVDFITDESRQLAKTLLTTKEYNKEIAASTAKIAEYQRQLAKVGADEAKRAPILAKIAAEEKKVADNLGRVATEGKKVEKLDLNRVAPAQLVERARQLSQAMRLIPQSAPQFRQLQTELSGVNARLREINQTARAGQGGGGFGSLAGVATRAGVAIGGAIAVVRGFFSSLSGASKLEQLNISFETFLGNAEKAKTVVADLRKFADVTPFETEEVNKAGRSLLAFGFSAEELIPTLTKVGDVASGTGKDFNELALIYGKARAEGLIQNDTLNQLAEAGIPIYSELARVLNVNESQIRKLAEQGKIQFSDLQQAFTNLTSEGGRFAGLMERQSKSLDGLFSTLVSAIQNKLTNAMNDLLPVIKSITKGFIDFLSVPVSQTLEQERQAFNGVALSILNAKEGTEERTKAIKNLQEQYPAFLGNIDAEKATNEQLKPILDQINQSYVIRIALQKQQEKLQPLLEAQAEQETRLAEGRASANRLLARGAELAGVNLQQFGSQAEQVQAVIAALNKTAQFQSAGGFDRPLNEQARVLNQIKTNLSSIDATTTRQRFATQQVTEAEQERQGVVAELRKTYADVFAILDKEGNGNTVAQKIAPNPEESKKRAEAALQAALKAVEVGIQREELLLENQRIKGEIDEAEYQTRLTAITEQGLNARLDVLRQFGRERTNAALEVQNNLAEIQAGRDIRGAAPVAALPTRQPGQVTSQTQEDIDLGPTVPTPDALRARFSELLNAELQYNILRSELQSAYYAEQLAQLSAAGKNETDEYNRIAEQKKAADQSVADNKDRLSDFQLRLEAAQQSAFSESINFAITLLGKDEAARKKYAGAIKAFQIGEVVAAGIAEIQKIYSKYSLVPGGALIAQAEAIPAGIRTAAAVVKIAAQKFARGGYTGSGIGAPDETGYRPAGIVHEGEYVVPKNIVQNAAAAPVLRWLEGKRLRGYADGGLVSVNTTPTALPTVPVQATAALANMDVFIAAVGQFTAAVAAFPKEVKSRVVLTELETAQGELDGVRADAAV